MAIFKIRTVKFTETCIDFQQSESNFWKVQITYAIVSILANICKYIHIWDRNGFSNLFKRPHMLRTILDKIIINTEITINIGFN